MVAGAVGVWTVGVGGLVGQGVVQDSRLVRVDVPHQGLAHLSGEARRGVGVVQGPAEALVDEGVVPRE